jgi:hypothetical protein
VAGSARAIARRRNAMAPLRLSVVSRVIAAGIIAVFGLSQAGSIWYNFPYKSVI